MATSYTSLLGLALPVTGELSGTWGDTVNNYISTYIDAAVAGAQTVTADTTLTKTTGASLSGTSSQYAIIIASPASANITITAPAASKIYTIINTSATYTVKIVGAGPTTGVTLGVSEKAQVAWNGSDFVRIGASGGPGVFSSITNTGLTAGRVVFSSTGGLEADSANLVWDNTNAYLGIGTSSPAVYTANSKLLQIDGGANAAEFKMTNSTTGSTGADGTLFQLNGSAFYLWNLENSFLSFGTNNTERMRLDSSGNLGIGLSSPTRKLQVQGEVVIGTLGVSGSYAVTYNPDTAANTVFWTKTISNSFAFGQGSDPYGGSAVELMRLTSAGNLGIGTSSPNNMLEIRRDTTTAASTPLIFMNNRSTGTTPYYAGGLWGGGYRDVRDPGYIAGIDFYRNSSAGGLSSAGEIRFYTCTDAETLAAARSGSERMRLDSSGNLLVGTTSSLPSGLAGVGIQGGIGFSVSGTYYWSIQSNASDFYIGPSNLSRFAQLNGITTFTAWTFSSDRRIKNSIQDIGYGLAEVLSMQPRQYKFNDDDEFKIGFVAQELKEVVPEAVTGEEIEFSDDDTPQERAKKTMGVSKETLIPVLVKAIQEQQAMIQSLTDRIAQLEAK